MAKIYTRTGDDGSTGLPDGARVPKDHPRCAACGDVDELGAALGAARAFVRDREVTAALLDIQQDLMAAGSVLAGASAEDGFAKKTTAFEKAMDLYEEDLAPLTGFIIRGGSKGAALIHLACTVCRRAERGVTALAREAAVPPALVAYLNRLSDFLFVLARVEDKRETARLFAPRNS